MTPLKYRSGHRKKTRIRNNPEFGTKIGHHQVGPQAVGLHGNLTTAEYQELDGPRLAPRRDGSRVITNLRGGFGRDTGGSLWYAEAAWFEVISNKGFPFLRVHFDGNARIPRYDLRPVRAAERALCGRQARAFMLALVRSQ